MEQVYIRVDGNEIIASGHVMRCLTIAEQLRAQGAEVVFLTSDTKPVSLIESRGYPVDVLDTVWNDLGQETAKICDYITSRKIKLLLIDSYYVTAEYLQALSQIVKTAYIDDLNSFLYPVHTLIYYGAFADAVMYQKPYVQKDKRVDFLIGSAYIPLRKEFAKQPFQVKPRAEKVLITTGGTDQLNAAGKLLRAAETHPQLKELQYHVIVGCFNQNKEELYFLAKKYSNIFLHENVTNMSEWMRYCDLAVSAAGTTIYELCACGIPTVCFEVAENQEGARRWEEHGYMFYAGNAYKDIEKCIQGCVEALVRYVGDYQMRKTRSMRLQSLVDGHGAERIAKHLLITAEK